jgi:hypothetical protein
MPARRVVLLSTILLGLVILLYLHRTPDRTEPTILLPTPTARAQPSLPPALPTNDQEPGAQTSNEPPGATVIVHVVDRTGAAIPGAHIDTGPPVFTDDTGHATLHASWPSQDLQFRVHADGYAAADVEVATGDDPAAIVPMTVTLGPAGRFGGVVLDDRGHPVADAEIYAYVDAPHWVEFAHSDGRCAVADIAASPPRQTVVVTDP